MNINLQGHNDANSNQDAGNAIGDSLEISPGEHSGFLSYSDRADWYEFNAASGQSIQADISVATMSDFNQVSALSDVDCG